MFVFPFLSGLDDLGGHSQGLRVRCVGRQKAPTHFDGALWYLFGVEPWLWSLLLKPFVALIVFGLICLPVRLLVHRWMKDGKLKRLLLGPITGRL
jgi:hypothetical protein